MGFGIDMAKAREIHKTNIRTARTPLLAALDIEFQKAQETSASTTDIVAKKQALRDAPADSGIVGPVISGKPLSKTLGKSPCTFESTSFINLDLNCSELRYL